MQLREKDNELQLYQGYRLYNKALCLLLEELLYSDENGYPITYAAIQKILYSREEKRFVFIAIAVSELAYTKDIHVFFDRFQIDPLEYQMTAFVGQDGIGGDPIPYVDWPGRPQSGQQDRGRFCVNPFEKTP